MHRSFLLSRAAFAGTLALGCADQQWPTALADPPVPSLGASVERGTEPFGFCFGDGNRTLCIGVTFEDLISIFCTGADFDVDQLDALHLFRPDGSRKDQLKGKDVNVVVVEIAEILAFNCDNLPPHLPGTARVVLNDNDFFVTGNRANASMLHVTGRVTDESGQLYHLVAAGSQVLAPGHPAPDVVVQHLKVQIHLTPIGQ